MIKRMTYADEHEARANMEAMGSGMSVAEQRMIVEALDDARVALNEMCEHATTHGYAALATEMRRRGRAPIGQPPLRTEPSAPSEAGHWAEWAVKFAQEVEAATIGMCNGNPRITRIDDASDIADIISALGPPPSAPSPDDGLLMSVAEAAIADAGRRLRAQRAAWGRSCLVNDAASLVEKFADLPSVISTARRTARAKDGAE
jgi:hypothetical protein